MLSHPLLLTDRAKAKPMSQQVAHGKRKSGQEWAELDFDNVTAFQALLFEEHRQLWCRGMGPWVGRFSRQRGALRSASVVK